MTKNDANNRVRLLLPVLIAFAIICLMGAPAVAVTTVIGEQSGVWSVDGSPYAAIGDIIVPEGETLEIEPGVDVIFMGLYYFTVSGRLTVNGGDDFGQRVRFMRDDSLTWQGIYFEPESDDRSIINGCDIINAYIGIDLNHASPSSISRNAIYAINTGINCVEASPVISANVIIRAGTSTTLSTATGISLLAGSNALIQDNPRIEVIGGALTDGVGILSEHSYPIIRRNWIEVRAGGVAQGILARNLVKLDIIQNVVRVLSSRQMACGWMTNATNVFLRNNTFVLLNSNGEAFGLNIGGGSQVTLINNIILGNGNSVALAAPDSNISRGSNYNDFWGHAVFHRGQWEGYMTENPLFRNHNQSLAARPEDYYLIGNERNDDGNLIRSPCIDAGDPNYMDPDSTRSDIGRYYFHQVRVSAPKPPVVGEYDLIENFPNPFNRSTRIKFGLKAEGTVRLILTDVTGREVAELFNGALPQGRHDFVWQAVGMPAGAYFIHLETPSGRRSKVAYLMP